MNTNLHQNLVGFIWNIANKLRGPYLRDQIELSISGADGLANNIPQSSVKAYRFLAPPLAEQQELVSNLSTRLAPMAKTERSVRNAIDKLKEYRSALITAAVTGKIDVRHFQAPEGESHALAALS